MKQEDDKYVTLCQKMFYQKAKVIRSPLKFSDDDPSISDLDRKILPTIMAGSILGSVSCDKNCPGYTPIPVEPFSLPNGEVVRCQRYIPKEMLRKGWDVLREYALNFGSKRK